MIGNAGHRHPMPLAHLSGGKDNLQFPRGKLGILIKGLIEIAQAEEDNSLGILLLNPEVLLPDRGRAFFHISLFY
ncbi:hypothetical protein ES703_100608 [subsurface metagenome]